MALSVIGFKWITNENVIELVSCMGFGVWGLGFGVWGLGFGVWGLGFGEIGRAHV